MTSEQPNIDDLAIQLGDPRNYESAFERLLNMEQPAVAIFIRVVSARPMRGILGDGDRFYDGDLARRLAAEGLGRLKDPIAVEALVKVLADPDEPLRARAVWALGEIGDAHAVPALIPLLGNEKRVEETRLALNTEVHHEAALDSTSHALTRRTFSELIAFALCKLDESALVEAFFRTLQGNRTALENLRGQHCIEIVGALLHALDSPHISTAANAAWALGELGAVAALPKLRSKVRAFGFEDPKVKTTCAQAIATLEALAALPRPAESASININTLPRAAKVEAPTTETLPRAASDEGNKI